MRPLWLAVGMPDVRTLPEFIQLLDDDFVSLTALTLIANPNAPFTRYNRFSHPFDNWFDNRLYRVNGA